MKISRVSQPVKPHQSARPPAAGAESLRGRLDGRDRGIHPSKRDPDPIARARSRSRLAAEKIPCPTYPARNGTRSLSEQPVQGSGTGIPYQRAEKSGCAGADPRCAAVPWSRGGGGRQGRALACSGGGRWRALRFGGGWEWKRARVPFRSVAGKGWEGEGNGVGGEDLAFGQSIGHLGRDGRGRNVRRGVPPVEKRVVTFSTSLT